MSSSIANSLQSVKQGHQPRKRFGQNFLHDPHVIREIVESIHLNRDDNLVEIGPGMGALTEPLLSEVDAMTVIELDRDLASSLRIRIGANSHPNFDIINTNALQFDYSALYSEDKGKLRIVGNLPYNISTPILFRLLEFDDIIQDMHFMLQKEVVERITADVGNKIYGRLSVIMQYYCDTEYLITVPKGAFNPPPKVTSAVFRLTPHAVKPIVADNEQIFAIVVREAFNYRRKTLRAILKNSNILPTFMPEDFETLGIDSSARPETLDVTQFVALSNLVNDKLISNDPDANVDVNVDDDATDN